MHRVNIASVAHAFEDDWMSLQYCHTDLQRPNGLTKIVVPHQWPLTLQQYGLKPAQEGSHKR